MHILFTRTSAFAYDNIVLILGAPAGSPNPRYVKPTSIPILAANDNVASTTIIELIFGKIPLT